MARLTFVPAASSLLPPLVLDERPAADESGIKLRDLEGLGIPDLDHQTVRIPGRDGETLLRTMIEPRFVTAHVMVVAPSLSAREAVCREVMRYLNPKLGLGELHYQPNENGPVYIVDAIIDRHVGFDRRFPLVGTEALSFRCPDPAWREQTENAIALGAGGGGLAVPLAVPLTLAEAGNTQTITNTGDLDVYPVLTATGTFAGLRVTNETAGKLVWFPDLAVADGHTLVLDLARRTATLDGTNVMPFRSPDSEAWPLVRGANTVTVTVSSGTVALVVTFPTLLIGV